MIMRGAGNTDFWASQSVLNPANSSLSFSGRLIGPVIYDGLTSVTDDTKTDYTLDYPSTEVAGLAENERGFFVGTSFGDNFDPGPYRVERTGAVSAFLHPEVMQAKPQFYRLTIYRSCVEADPDAPICAGRQIPDAEKNLNYPPIGYFDDNDQAAVFEPEYEEPREEYYGGTFQIEILDDGTVVTDSDGNCEPVNADYVDMAGAGRQEYPVGLVSRTHMPEANEKV